LAKILAAIGRGQLDVLGDRVQRKREIFDYYRAALEMAPGIEFMPEAGYGRCNYSCRVVGGAVAADLFAHGLCLPSGTAMTDSDLDRVFHIILECRKQFRGNRENRLAICDPFVSPARGGCGTDFRDPKKET
jgi:dTDP-4-amino-4,6-dideoxygalactose transaminase